MPTKTDDPDETLLEPPIRKRPCIIARLIDQLEPAQARKVEEALALPKETVPGRNIAEYLRRKTGQPIHDDTLAKHRRGDCGCHR